MSEHIGRQEQLGIAVETVRNTPATVASKWVKHTSASIISKVEKAIDDNVRGVFEDSEGARVTKKWFDGDLEGILHIDTIGYLFLNVYGNCDSTPSDGATTHEFTVDQSAEHPTLTIFRKDSDATQKVYGGGVINTLEINAVADDYVRFTANIICANESANSDTPSYDTEYDFVGKEITIKLADTEEDLPSATALNAKECKITFDTGAISDFNLGSYNPQNYNAKMSIEAEIKKNFVDTTFEDLFKNNTYKYMEITIEGESSLEGSSEKPTLTLLLNKTQVIDWSREAGADDLASETFTIKAFYNNDDSQASKLTLTNITNSYAIGS